jgi:hypothetical protein
MSLSTAASSTGQEAVIHHAANTAAIAIPVGAVMFHLPEIVAIITGILGIVWYSILIVEKVASWRAQWLQIRQSSRSVVQRLKDENPPRETPPSP